MSNLVHEISKHLNDNVIVQLSKQIGAQDPNQVKKAAGGVVELLLEAMSRNAQHQERGGGLLGALKKDHDGGILGDLLGVLSGKQQVNNQSTTNGTGIVNHLLGNKQLQAAQVISQMSGIDIFKSGVLMQLIAPVVMGVAGQAQKSKGLDLGGLAQVLLGGAQGGQQRGAGGGVFGKLLDMDGDGNMMDDLLNIGMKILTK